jgi:hypothetical protein
MKALVILLLFTLSLCTVKKDIKKEDVKIPEKKNMMADH